MTATGPFLDTVVDAWADTTPDAPAVGDEGPGGGFECGRVHNPSPSRPLNP